MPILSIPLPAVSTLHDMLRYDPETGALYWRRAVGPKKAGSLVAKASPDGYVRIGIKGRTYSAHRVIWKMMTGSDPVAEIDHRDGDRSNNMWANLREASHYDNMCNSGAYSKTSGLPRGVAKNTASSGYSAQIQKNHRMIHIGVFATPEEAHAAYKGAAKILHGDFAHAENRT
ncbi:HNH endonuclease [Aureimonas altamirensis DSM 21988]|uniref:Pathogenesis-related transcriptional factor and ERF protein n=2 Tax=Aureimonas altamirensis TaxID=370622 RepID=A0A0P0YX43_9HYPH|nr:HNH endonuclease [Aureimonas altamirensis]BAT26042.1 pathogenesis-related transcriptional factor and ERF protein [Aureimonas altamirensis]SHI79436.1 HNH endonuclease [Aureimonas altamirensis DSM 21988]